MIRRTHQRTSLRTKQGFTILGDLVWIIVFCVAATLLFYFLYKPLIEDKIVNKPAVRLGQLDILPIYGDAQYVAQGLRETRAITGGGPRQASTFGGIVKRIADARSSASVSDDLDAFIETSGYDKTLDSVFDKTSPFWTAGSYSRANGIEVTERQRVAVIMLHNGEWYGRTCREYVQGIGYESYAILCTRFENGKIIGATTVDPDTGITIPQWRRHIEPGSFYVPSGMGPATVFVFIEREEDS